MAQSAEFARSLSELSSEERACSNMIGQERQDVLYLLKAILDLHLAAMHIRQGLGWSGYGQLGVAYLSVRAFHTARAAMIIARAGYPREAVALLRVLEDTAEQCRLYSKDESAAKKWLHDEKAPSAAQIRASLGESVGDWYDSLHAFVHSRIEAVATYARHPSPKTIEFRIGPDADPAKFTDIALSIVLWELRTLSTEASVWPCLNKDQSWAEQFDRLYRRFEIALEEAEHGGSVQSSAAG